MEKPHSSLKINFLMNAILTMSSFIFPVITFPYVSRILLPEGIGKVSFAISVLTYFNMLSQLGIPTYGVRVCAKTRDNKEEFSRTAQELFIINLIMSLIAYILFLITLLYVPKFKEDRLLYVIVSVMIIFNTIGMEWLYKGLEQYRYITIRSIVFKFIALIGMFFLVHDEKDYMIYGGISIFAASASNLFNFMNIHKYIDIKPVGNYCFKRHIKSIFIFFAMSCATVIYTNLDTVMLGFMTNNIEVGYYNAAIKIKTILVSVVTSLGAVLLPRASYYIEYKMIDEFYKITKKAINFVFIIATPLMVYFILYAKQGILFLSGENYSESIIPMRIIMITLLLVGITNILGIQVLVPMGKEKIVLYSEIAGAVVDLVINIILIPQFSSVGAAIGTVIAETVVLVVQVWALKDYVADFFQRISYNKIITGILAAGAASLPLKKLQLGVFGCLVFSAMVFFGVYSVCLVLLKENFMMQIVNQFIRHKDNREYEK